ncbi:MAG: hypothetical protein P4L34_12950 [Paludibacter sp.]|nr:hypothetical protein [Paludibacter sp.]
MKALNSTFFKLLQIVLLLWTSTSLNAATITSTSTGGDWNSTSTWVGNIIPLSTDGVIIATTGSGSVTTSTGTITCASVTINSGSILTMNRPFVVNGATLINGRINFGSTNSTSCQMTFNGSTTLNSGAIWNETNSLAIPTFTFSNNFTNNGTTFTALTGSHTFTGSSMVINCSSITSIANVTINGTYTNSGLFTVSTSLTGTGTLTNDVTGTLTLLGTTSITNLNAAASGNTVIYSGGSQTVKPSIYSNLTLGGSGTKTTTSITVNGILSMEGTQTISAAPTYGSNATLQYNSSSSKNAGAEWITPFVAIGGVYITNTGTINLYASKVFNISVPLTINNNAKLATHNNQLTFGGNFINNGTFTAGSSNIVIANTMASQSIAGFTTTGTVSMTKTGGTATFTGAVNGGQLFLNGNGGTLNLGVGLTHTFSNTWTRTNGTLDGGSSTLRLGSGYSGSGGTFTANTGTVEYYAANPQTLAQLTYNNLILSGTSAKTTTGITVNGILSMEGTATATVVPTYGASATLQYKGSAAQTTGIEFPSIWSSSGGVKIENANGVTLNAAKNIGSNPFTIGSIVTGSIFNDGSFQLTATGILNLTSGTYNVNYSNFPSFTTMNTASGTTVNYAAPATQTISSGTYSNLTISGTGTNSKTANGDVTVNGILNLISANASATQGCLEMGTNTLFMGATATTTGTGDVTGIVNRTTFVVNTPYSFGNQFTTLALAAGGILPSSVSFKIVLTPIHTWKADAINRYYDIIQTGGSSATLVTLNLHYLPSELNSATEGNLDMFDYHVSQTLQLDDHGRSNYSTTDKWVGVTERSLTYTAPQTTFPSKYYTLGTSQTPNFTWLGANSSDWNDANNWVGGVPTSTSAVVIPDKATTVYQPTLPATASVASINILSGGVLNDGGGSILTVNGGLGSWNNLGAFNPGTSTVIFTNALATMSDPTNFYNVTVADGANLSLGTNNVMRIAGTLSLSATGILNAANNLNTVEYNGVDQTIINPNGSTNGYSNLILSGSGTKTLPSTAMTVSGDFTMNGTGTANAGNTINFIGNVILNSGTFNASSFTHSVNGNWTNNGGAFVPGTSTVNFNNASGNQTITGTSNSQTFNNITLSNTGQTLNVSGSTTTLTLNGNLAISSGTFDVGTALTLSIAGNWSNSGIFNPEAGSIIFNGTSAQTITGNTTYNNLTINNSAGVSSVNDLTVNGTLYLQSANTSATQGCLDMGANTLNMGPTSITSGLGDVTGTVSRNAINANTLYTFGNPNSSIIFAHVGTLPTSMSINLSIGTAPSWKTNAIQRKYTMFEIGATNTQATIKMHYLDSELNLNTESSLVPWYSIDNVSSVENSRSDYDATNNYITMSNINFSFPTGTQFTLANSAQTSCIWTGVTSSDWNDNTNWINSTLPIATSNVIIPSGTAYSPSLPLSAEISTINIQNGAILNSATNAVLTIDGSNGAWNSDGTFNPANSTIIFVNPAATISGTTNFYNITINPGSKLETLSGSVIGIAGTVNNNGVWNTTSQGTTTVNYNGVDQFVVVPNPATNQYSNLILSGSGTKTLPAVDMTINGDFTMSGSAKVLATEDLNLIGNVSLASGTTFDASNFTINIGGNLNNNGTFNANTSTVVLNGTATQSVSGTINFNNLTINNIAGASAANDLTVNGVLNLQSPNASETAGSLDMGAYTLDMGGNATTTGLGDVTGIVRRTSMTTNVSYTFGNQFTNIKFPVVTGQTLPTTMSLKIKIGTAPTWTTGISPDYGKPAIKRIYEISQSGGTGTKADFNIHYLDSELNGNTENLLSGWTHSTLNGTGEQGRSNFDMTNEWVGVSDANIAPFNNVPFGNIEISLAETSGISTFTWNGSVSSDWVYAKNWTPNSVPSLTDSTANIVIPDASTTPNILTIPTGGAILKTLYIQNGGILNSGDNPLTISGSTGAWINTGTFNSGIGTVTFTGNGATYSGTTNFYNLVINLGANLENRTNSIMRIGNIVTNNGIWNTALLPNTVEFNGSDQTVLNTNGSNQGFYNLILSGSGIKTMPESAFSIAGDFTLTGTATVTADSTMTIGGNLTIDNGATFNTGVYTDSIGGNWTNNGTFTTTGTINLNGKANTTISGGNFNNLIISGTGMKNALSSISVSGNFSLLSGQFVLNNATSNNLIITGNFNQSGGIFDFNQGNSGTSNMFLSGNFSQTTGDATMKISGAGAQNATIYFNGPATQTLSFADPVGATSVGYSIPSGKKVQLLSNIALNSADGISQLGYQGAIFVNGTLDLGTYQVYQAGGLPGTALFTVYPGATLITSNANGISGSVSPINMTNTFSSSANYEFQGISTGSFTTTPSYNTVNNLNINNPDIVTLTNSLKVEGLLTLSNGKLKLNADTLTIAGSSAINLLNGIIDATVSSSTVDYAGISAQTIETNQYLNGQIQNLCIDNSQGVRLNTDLNVNNVLTINPNNSLTVSAGNQMNVTGTIVNNAGVSGLIIESTPTKASGTLIFHNTIDSPVPATVEMYSKAAATTYSAGKYSNYKWQFFGIPVSSIPPSPALDGSYVRVMNENDTPSHWSSLTNASILDPFTGYEITQVAPTTIFFQGNLVNSDYTTGQLSYTAGASYPGQHLIGNPYTTALDIRQLNFGADMDATVYIYNTGSLADWSTNSGGTSFGTYPGQYTSIPRSAAGIGGIQRQIASMQGFLIMTKNTSGDLTFGFNYNSIAVKDTTMQKTRGIQKVSASGDVYTRIDVTGSRFSDTMWILTIPTCSHGYDNGWDGTKLLGSTLAPQIFGMETSGNYQVDALDNINETYIGFLAGEDSVYTLTFTNQNLSTYYTHQYLLDLLENTTTDITTSGTQYTFNVHPSTLPVKRFEIVTSLTPTGLPMTAADNNNNSSNIKIFSSEKTIFIQNNTDFAGNLTIYDISGRVLNKIQFSANGITTIPTNLTIGTYLVKGETINTVVSKQIILK